jgi:hypothetical protein
MTYEILRARLTELELALRRVDLPQFQADDDAGAANPAPRLFVDIDLDHLNARLKKGVWIYLEGAIASQARARATETHDLRKRLEELDKADPAASPDPKVWGEYVKLNGQSQAIVREFVELVAGLAFRDRSKDPWIFDAVDQLIVEYATAARQQWEPLSVPWVQDAIVKTLARVMRLRFQDWTIWGLPTTAFEFWRVLLESDRRPDQVQNLLDYVTRSLPEPKRLSAVERVLVADALATYMMGVSYAAAAIVLRFEPQDRSRAFMVLEALRLVGRRRDSEAAGVYDERYVAPLQEWWNLLAGADPLPDEQARARVTALAKLSFDGLQDQIPSASYRADNLSMRVRPVADIIGEGRTYPENAPIKAGDLTLRDVMNSAWAARLTFPATKPRDIAGPAIELCRKVLAPKVGDDRKPATPASTGQPGPMV